MERVQRLADVFDVARVAKALDIKPADFGKVIYKLIEDEKLDRGHGRKPPGRNTRGKQNN